MCTVKIDDIFKHDFIFTEEQIHIYSQISGDINPIHVDKEYAKENAFGRNIVHGYFSISVFSKVYGTLLYPEGHILISQSAKYISPIFADVKYTAVFTVKQLMLEKNRVLYVNEIFDTQTKELKVTGEAVLMNKNYYK